MHGPAALAPGHARRSSPFPRCASCNAKAASSATTTCIRRPAALRARPSTPASTFRRRACTRIPRANSASTTAKPAHRRTARRVSDAGHDAARAGLLHRVQGQVAPERHQPEARQGQVSECDASARALRLLRLQLRRRAHRAHLGRLWTRRRHGRRVHRPARALCRREARRASPGSSPSTSSIRTTSCSSMRAARAAGCSACRRWARPAMPLYEKDWHFDLPRSYRADDLSTKPAVQRPPRPLTEEQLRIYQNYYFNCIRDVDQHVGVGARGHCPPRIRAQHGRRRHGRSRRAGGRARRNARQRRGSSIRRPPRTSDGPPPRCRAAREHRCAGRQHRPRADAAGLCGTERCGARSSAIPICTA